MRGRAFALSAGLLLALACAPRPPAPTGIVLVSIDTLRADHLGCYGYPRDTSPHLDALAAEGILFERAVAQAASTFPSHLSLFHSRLPSRTRSGDPPLAEVLRRHGFRTAAFTGGGNVSARLGFGAGFERYEEDLGLAEAVAGAEAWLRERAGEPFFVFVHGYDVHAPYDPPEPWASLFSGDYAGPVRAAETLDLLRRVRRVGRHRDSGAEPALSPADRAHVVALYDGGVRHADAQIGALVAALDALGLGERVVVVVLSDHGEEFWEHGSVMHRHALHQEVIHVPLVWRLPGPRFAPLRGTRMAATVPLLDVAPTLLELLGVPPPPRFEGRSLLPLVEGSEGRAASGAERVAVSELAGGAPGGAALIAGPWKLIVAPDRAPRLFHLDDDPGEHDDRAAGRPERVAALRARLAAQRGRDVDGPGAAPDFDPDAVEGALRERLRELGYVE